MFSKNLETARKQKGMSQEYLANQLHVVRQTISKWEKGLSVPDAETLIALSELLDVSVSDLLGKEMHEKPELSDVAEQLSQLNALLASQEAKITKYLKLAIGFIAVVIFLGAIYPIWNDMWYEFGKILYYVLNP